MEPMEDTDDVNERPSKSRATLLGIPIETQCQRDALFYGISGGILSGLVGFLFTSHPTKSSYIGMGSYGLITLCYACHCIYNDNKMRKELRIVQRTIREAHLRTIKTERNSEPESV